MSKEIGAAWMYVWNKLKVRVDNALHGKEIEYRLDIPVYCGSSGPLLKHPDTPEIVHGSDGFGDCAHLFSTGQGRLEELPAPAALVELSRTHGPFTLAALGPLTNVALAQRLDPGFTARLERIVFLGGNYKGVGNTTESAEFNFYCDPEAAHIVLSEAQCPVQMVPWETTMEYGIEWASSFACHSLSQAYITRTAYRGLFPWALG
ncbi:Uncharacterized protein C1683.06c, partial [Araneus ventricosus]